MGWCMSNSLIPDPQTSANRRRTRVNRTRPCTPATNTPKVEQANPNPPAEVPTPPQSDTGWSDVGIWALRGGVFMGLLLWPLVVFALIVSWKKLRRRARA
jgi:hypothetical protein